MASVTANSGSKSLALCLSRRPSKAQSQSHHSDSTSGCSGPQSGVSRTGFFKICHIVTRLNLTAWLVSSPMLIKIRVTIQKI